MNKPRFSKYLLLILSIIIYNNVAMAAEPNKSYDQCYLNKINNSKIGYSCVNRKFKQENQKNLIYTSRYSEQEFKRFGFTVKITQDLLYVEDENGNPVSFSAKIDSIGEKINISGEFTSPDVISVKSEVNGLESTSEIKLDKKVLFPYGIDRLYTANSDTPVITYSTIEPSSDIRITTITAEKVGKETLSDVNLNNEYTKYKVKVDFLPNIDNFEWRDDKGKVIREISSVLNIEEVAVSKDKIFEKADSLDLFAQSLISVDANFPGIAVLDQVSYKIETKDLDPEEIFLSDSRQRIVQSKGNITYLKIKEEEPLTGKYRYPVNTKGLSDYLKSGPFIITDNSLIKKQSDLLVEGETDAYKIAKKMEKWTYQAISRKDFSTNFGNAADVLKSKQGDCTEHAVLLASLLRTAGIPAKIVVGLVYMDKPQKAFGYHMWVKAYTGQWINLEPTLGDETFSPVHIALYETPLNKLSDRSDVVIDIMKSLSRIKINILNYSVKGNNLVNISLPDKFNQAEDNKISFNNLSKNDESNPLKRISLKNTSPSTEVVNTQILEKDKEFYLEKAMYKFANGQINPAKEDFQRAIEQIPFNDDFSSINLAAKLASMGLFNMAEQRFSSVSDYEIWNLRINGIKKVYFPKKVPSEKDEILLAQISSKIDFQNNPESATGLFKKLNSSLKNSDYGHYLQAKIYVSQKNTGKAIQEFQKAIVLNPSNIGYRFELAKAYLQKANYAKAEQNLSYILQQSIVDKEFTKLVSTEWFWAKAKMEKQNSSRNQYYLAQYYHTKGENKHALDILNRLLAKKERYSYVYELLGDIYLELNELDKAASNYQLALKNNPKNADALLGIGKVHYINGKYKESLAAGLKAAKIKSKLLDAQLLIADNYKALSQEELAYNYYSRVLKVKGRDEKANYNIGLKQLSRGEYNLAKKEFYKALSVNPMQEESWIQLARIEIRNKNYFLAKAYLAPVLFINPNNARYYYYLGLINKDIENYSAARHNFKKALEIEPEFAEAIKAIQSL